MAEDAGALIVRAGLIAEEQLLVARHAQAANGGTLGEHLVLAGFSQDEPLAEFYRTRLMVPRVTSRQLARIGKDIIGKIPAEMASEFRCMPVSLDRDGNLTVAMADPSITQTADELAFFTGYHVIRAVATQSEIAWALAYYYGRLTPLGEQLMHDPGSAVIPGPMPPMAALTSAASKRAQQQQPGSRSITNRILDGRHHAMTPVTSPFRRRPSETPVRPIAPDEPWLTSEQREPESPPGSSLTVLPTPEERRVVSSPIPVLIEESSSLPPHLQARQGIPRPQAVVSFFHDDITPTRPLPPSPPRPAENAPELHPRSGEVFIATGPVTIPDVPLPAVVIDGHTDEWSAPEGELAGDTIANSAPMHFHLEEADDEPFAADDDGETEPLDRPLAMARAAMETAGEAKARRRKLRRTMLGLGFGTSSGAAATESEAPDQADPEPIEDAAVPPEADSAPLVVPRSTISALDSLQKAAEAAAEVHARARDTQSNEVRSPVLPVSSERPGGAAGKPGTITNEPTERMERPPASLIDDIDDEEWGPPGTTIPPPFLGASIPPDERGPDGIPLDTDEFSDELSDLALLPLPEAAPAIPEPSVPEPVPEAIDSSAAIRRDRSGETVQAPLSLYDSENVTPSVLREFENSQGALAEVLRDLQLAETRDAVVEILVDHLHESHKHVAFFAVKSGRLEPWKIRGSALFPTDDPARLGRLWLRLDFSSTFHDIVATRLPFRGPITDEPSREFIVKTFGSLGSPMLGLPVTVRERVVGVLYGDTGRKRVFVENLGVMARAAGGALERILKNQKG